MTKKWKTVRVRQELVEEIRKEMEKGQYQSLSEFVSDAIRLRMQRMAKEEIAEHLLFYTPKHIWIKLTPEGNVKLGVTDYFENRLEGIYHIETDKVGEEITRAEPFGMVETPLWGGIYDLFSPIDGKMVKINRKVIDDPLSLIGDPYQWIVEIQPSNPEFSIAHSDFDKELKDLLSFEEYRELIAKLEGRPRFPPSDSELSEMVDEIKRSSTIL